MIVFFALVFLWSMLCYLMSMMVYYIVHGVLVGRRKTTVFAVTSGIMAVVFVVVILIVCIGGV